MIIIGLEGPSYSGKTTFSKQLLKKFLSKGYRSVAFPDYMEKLDPIVREKVPLDTNLTLEDEHFFLEQFLLIEQDRISFIESNKELDFVILDRTVFSLLAHNYILEKLTTLNFYQMAQNTIHSDNKAILIPDFYIYVNTSNETMVHRYPKDDKTLFTNAVYNDYFSKYYQMEKGKLIKRGVEVSLNSNIELSNNVDYFAAFFAQVIISGL